MAEYRSRRVRRRPRRLAGEERRHRRRDPGLYVMPLVVAGTILVGLAAGCFAAARLWWP